jgi:hypothetical protein
MLKSAKKNRKSNTIAPGGSSENDESSLPEVDIVEADNTARYIYV